MVIATSLTTAVLGSLLFEPSLSNMNAINYQPIGSGHSWDIGSLKSYTPTFEANILTEKIHVQELLLFASAITNNSVDIDVEIRHSIEKNFWDMI